MHKVKSERHFGRAAQLATLAIVGQGLIYLLTVILSHRLELDGFEAYVVASAAFTLMVSYAPLGAEKYALRLLPALFERGDWSRAKGFMAFGLRRTLRTSLLLGMVVGVWFWWVSDSPSAIRLAIIVSCLSLPGGALVHYGVEVLSANGHEIRAAAIFRVAVPVIVLVFVGLALSLPFEVSGATAVACWGLAWALALGMMVIEIRRTAPSQLWSAASVEEARTWRREALPFLAYRLSVALLAQAGVMALDVLQPSAAAVGAFAAAAGTANLVVVLATATNRFYARRLSILLEQRDYEEVLRLRQARRRWLVPTLMVFLVVVFGYGREILTLFHPEFVEEDYMALRVLAVVAAFTVLFSLAPTYLKYVKHNRLVFGTTAGTAVSQIVLLALLIPRFGATGAATAYAVSICGMYGVFAWRARRELEVLRADGAAST